MIARLSFICSGNFHFDKTWRDTYCGGNMNLAFIRPDQFDPWIKNQLKYLFCLKFSCYSYKILWHVRQLASSTCHKTFVNVGAKLKTTELFLIDAYSMDSVDPFWWKWGRVIWWCLLRNGNSRTDNRSPYWFGFVWQCGVGMTWSAVCIWWWLRLELTACCWLLKY